MNGWMNIICYTGFIHFSFHYYTAEELLQYIWTITHWLLLKECHRIRKNVTAVSIPIGGWKSMDGALVLTDSLIFIVKGSTKLWSASVRPRTICRWFLQGHISDRLRPVCMTMKGKQEYKDIAGLGHMSSEKQELQSGQLNPTTIILNFYSKKNLPPLI